MPAAPHKRSVYISDEMDRIVMSRRLEASLSYSERVSTLIERYAEVVRKYRPALTQDEWLILCERLRSFGHTVPTGLYPTMAAVIQVKAGTERGAKESVISALAKKIEHMQFVELVAIVDVVELYWSGKTHGKDGIQAILANHD